MANYKLKILEDTKIEVKLKISALWAIVMFLFAYGDIFGFFRTGYIEEVIAGKIAGNQINKVFLMGISIYIAIPSLMIFLSLVLKLRLNRWVNIALGIIFSYHIALLYWRGVGQLHFLEHSGKRASADGCLVRVDVARTSRRHEHYRTEKYQKISCIKYLQLYIFHSLAYLFGSSCKNTQ